MIRVGLSALVFLLSFLPALGEEAPVRVRIVLDPETPENSHGMLVGKKPFRFSVGLGAKGVSPAGSAFRPGYSLLGRFRVNAILETKRFEMEESLVDQSGKTREWLSEHLFPNMSSIDFDGNGEGGEYGTAFLSLAPLDSRTNQPFHFGDYAGVFRWYSYAIHGTQDPSRIGKRVTGGCLNVGETDLRKLVSELKLGDVVEVRLADP